MDTSLCRPEFPLDCVEVGVRGLCSLRVKNVERWLFEAGMVVTLSDPAGLMKDYDWIEPAGYPKVPFRYIESNVEAGWWFALRDEGRSPCLSLAVDDRIW